MKINNVELKEFHQKDLRPFSEIEYLDCEGNQLLYLEDGLFAFNLKLKRISFINNRISYINPQVFDHLSELDYLWLSGNVCEIINQTEISKIIHDAKKCSHVVKHPEVLIQLEASINEMTSLITTEVQTVEFEVAKLKHDLSQEMNSKLSDMQNQLNKSINTQFDKVRQLLDELLQKNELSKHEEGTTQLDDALMMRNVAIFTAIIELVAVLIVSSYVYQ